MSPSIESSTHGVPFSWENQPGTPLRNKSVTSGQAQDTGNDLHLPPPPYSTTAPKPAVHGIYVPLPPCAFQPPQKIAPTKGGSAEGDDPFLKAYLECTKSVRRSVSVNERKKDLWHKVKHAGLRIGLRLACNSNRHVLDSDIAPEPQYLDSD
jgi:hypothetical protein